MHGLGASRRGGPGGARCSPPSPPRHPPPCRNPARRATAGWRECGCRSRQIDANSSENGMVSATISAPRTLPRNRNRMIDHQDDALGQVVQHRVGGVVHQVAAVEERNDLHARRQNVLVQLLDFRVDGRPASHPTSAPLRSSTMPSTTSSLSMILPSSRWIALPNLAQPDLRALRHRRRCLCTRMRRAVLGRDHRVLDVVDVVDQARPRAR